jgi:hypothetical protein
MLNNTSGTQLLLILKNLGVQLSLKYLPCLQLYTNLLKHTSFSNNSPFWYAISSTLLVCSFAFISHLFKSSEYLSHGTL